jgi:TonB dependent receptor
MLTRAEESFGLTPETLAADAGLRFDQKYQYVDTNQLSPRLSFTYKPSENTTWHAGYARYFTPPVLVEAAPANIALFRNTTGAPTQFLDDPVLPERSHYFDDGVSRRYRWDAAHWRRSCSPSLLRSGATAALLRSASTPITRSAAGTTPPCYPSSR